MPALMTHDFFGKDAYEANASLIGAGEEARNAFLLGNQGPDPLFYLVVSPTTKDFWSLGGTMHHVAPSRLIAAFKESIGTLKSKEQAIGRAYAAGFLYHYTLDRAMHPLVYSQEFALCDAGVEGLDRSDGTEVHAEIEREFDEMILSHKLGQTIATYKPYEEVLRASDDTLATIGKMYSFVCMKTYGILPPANLFVKAAKNFRKVQHLFYSPNERRRHAFGAIETGLLHRRFSFFSAMSHRRHLIERSDFDNSSHATWENPFTHATSTDSFWDIYHAAQEDAVKNLTAFMADDFDEGAAARLTRGLDFSGEPVEE